MTHDKMSMVERLTGPTHGYRCVHKDRCLSEREVLNLSWRSKKSFAWIFRPNSIPNLQNCKRKVSASVLTIAQLDGHPLPSHCHGGMPLTLTLIL